ncbi:CshA/CshB family fibrillar adhesin-related protein [Bifidobacterium sp. ESL0775]|uniref:CshA/CshB family fibrillar adhesin-related protein n=1 Tax=Bifidobacterium sp. ESL0775 TaxID=2983230 RepID=UPI0023F9A94D|nr:CshA/CshB family fibrillar adhesin-related protein [Bifidobacterium sp. ESL0775]WEV69400.1 CshA/CshB family fibrillar adhesin-related protein [Bifidobacterium sp. ESL0775]
MAHGRLVKAAATIGAVAMALAGLVVASPANATSATGGNGRMLPDINWVEWGAEGSQITGPKVTWTTPVEIGSGHWSSTRCALAPSSDPATAMSSSLPIQAYRTGVYSGDALAQMYYEGGSGYTNKMTAGLANVNNRETVSFNFSCAAYLIDSGTTPTLNDGTNTSAPGFHSVALQGLVFADAESNNWTRHQQEYIKATPTVGSPTWRLLDSYRNPGCTTSSMAELNGNTLRFRSNGPQCANRGGTGPSSVMFMQGSTGATVTLRGGGETAVALGSIVASDFGDAPASYGAAGSLFQPTWQGGALGTDISGTPYNFPDPIDPDLSMVGGTLFNLSDARNTASTNPNHVASFAQPTPRLGDREDSEAEPHFSSGANWDDAHGDLDSSGHVINDEDGVDIPPGTKAINVTPNSSGIYRLTVRCHGTGNVRGWIDWNHDGTFSPQQATVGGTDVTAEASDQVACSTSSNTATLTWQVPDDAQNQISAQGNPSYLRLRITNDPTSNIQPTGMTGGSGGEVEDYKADVHVPTLSVLTNIVGDRKAGNDQFKMTAQAVTVGSTRNLDATTTGSENGIQSVQIGPRSVSPRSEYDITDALAPLSPSAPGDYAQTVKCVDLSDNSTVSISPGGRLTIPNNYDSNVQCTFREKAFPDPALTLITVVHNRYGGTKTPGDFTFTATTPGHSYSYSNTAGGDSHRVAAGDYTITGSALPDGYQQVGPIEYVDDFTGAPPTMVGDGPQLRLSQHVIGTRVVEDMPSHLKLSTVVDNSEGGTARPSDFNFSVTLDGRDSVDQTVFTEGAQQTIDAGKYTIKGEDLPAGYAQDGQISYYDDTAHSVITPVNEQIVIPTGHTVTGVRTVRSKPAKIEMITHVIGGGDATAADFPITITPTSGAPRSLPDSTTLSVPASTYTISTDRSIEPGYKVSRDLSCVVNDSEDITITSDQADLPNDQSLVCEQTVEPQTDETLTFETNVTGNGDARPSDFTVAVSPSAGGGPTQTFSQGAAQVPDTTHFTVAGSSRADYAQDGDIVYYLNSDVARAHPLTLAQAQQALRNGRDVTGVRTVRGHQPKLTVRLERDYRYGGTASGDGSRISLVPRGGSAQAVTLDVAKFETSGTYSVRQLLNAGYRQSALQVALASGAPISVASDGSFSVPQDADVVVTLKDVDLPATLSWARTDPSGRRLLRGSVWRLTGPDGQSFDVRDCTFAGCTGPDENPVAGRFRVTGLKWGNWTIAEIRAPRGYRRSPAFTLSIGAAQGEDGLNTFVAFREGKAPVVRRGTNAENSTDWILGRGGLSETGAAVALIVVIAVVTLLLGLAISAAVKRHGKPQEHAAHRR